MNNWTKAEHIAYVQGCLIATGEDWENHCQYGLHLAELAQYRRFMPQIAAEAERTLPGWLAKHSYL